MNHAGRMQSSSSWNSNMRSLAILLIACSVGCSVNRAPSELATALQDATSLELYSLDPTPLELSSLRRAPGDAGAQSIFHNWIVLGSTDVSAAAMRKPLLDSLDAGIADSDGSIAACFEPRHGLRAHYDGKTYDVVICFHCYQAQWHIDDVLQPGFTLTDLPQPTFDQTLSAVSVPLAPAATE